MLMDKEQLCTGWGPKPVQILWRKKISYPCHKLTF